MADILSCLRNEFFFFKELPVCNLKRKFPWLYIDTNSKRSFGNNLVCNPTFLEMFTEASRNCKLLLTIIHISSVRVCMASSNLHFHSMKLLQHNFKIS